ncbi:hypothetical protein ACSBR2_037956 [Camellia fascicularis]
MEQGGWIPVVKQRQGLFKLFTKFGIVKDVFIPQKRRKVTNTRFGFVRFDCSVAVSIAVQKANGLWVEDKALEVKYVEHDRKQYKNNPKSNPTRRDPLDKGRDGVAHIQRNGGEHISKSFADALRTGEDTIPGRTRTTIKVNDDGHGWLYESILARLKNEYTLSSIKKALKDKGLDHTLVRQGGGRDVVLTFKSKEEMKTNFSLVNEWLQEWCEFVTEWKPNMPLAQERCLWLRCYGILLNLWNRDTFNKLGGLRGKINKEINLECKGRVVPILVCEEQFNEVRDYNLSIDIEKDCSSNKIARAEHEKPMSLEKDEGEIAKRVEMDEVELASSDDVAHV